MSTQPEALRLADWLDGTETDYLEPLDHVAAELRRLHALNAEILEALKLADAMLSGANMNAGVVEKKVRAAIAKAEGK